MPVAQPNAHLRLALATYVGIPGVYPDDEHFVAALHALGVDAMPCVWSDPGVEWSAFDAVLFRTPWDYFQRPAEFARWLDSLPVPTINDAALVRWNADKRYLLELQGQGVAIIPTRIVEGAALAGQLHALRGRELVIKPTVSGGAWHTVRGVVGDPAFARAVAELPDHLDFMVQDFIPQIVDDGEWSLLFFDGVFSHAVVKRPARGDYRVQGQFGGSVEAVEPSAALIETAHGALRAAAALGYPDTAYARVDGVVVDGCFLLMELEVIEPALFLADRPDAAERFAANLVQRLKRAAQKG